MVKAREEQLKDFKKLVRLTKKLILLIKERNSFERDYMSRLEEYFNLQEDIKVLEDTSIKSNCAAAKKIEYMEFLKEELGKIEKENPITSEKKKQKKKIDTLSMKIKEYVDYIKSKSHDFIYFNLTWDEYKFCGCDVLSVFLIVLIFKESNPIIQDICVSELILLDADSKENFTRRVFLYDNEVRTALTKKYNKEYKVDFPDSFWEKEVDLIDFPLFGYFDFESFTEML